MKKVTFIFLLCCLNSVNAYSNEYYDPLEKINRPIFEFNQDIDKSILKPVAQVYSKEVPSVIRHGVSNIMNYMSMPFQIVYHSLKADKYNTGNSIAIFMLNTIGFGVFDIASEAGLSNNKTNLGDVLFHFGLPAGPFIEIPFLGGASLRNSTAKLASNNLSLIESNDANNLMTILGIIDWRYQMLPYENILNDMAFDKYLLYRNATLQREIKN